MSWGRVGISAAVLLTLGMIGWFTYPVLTVLTFIVLIPLLGVGTRGWWRRAGSAELVNRWSAAAKRHHGVASKWAILRLASGSAMRRKAHVLRPSHAALSRVARRRAPITELATPLLRVGWLRVYSPIEDVTLGLGGPRTGKSGELACRILDAPGAVICTSTRTDLLEHTSRERARKGPVYVFNPSRLGNLPSTITFSPLTGCEDPTVASARAMDMLSATARNPGDEQRHWLSLARSALAALMHAAALDEGSMWDVRAWVADPEQAAPLVMRILSRSPRRVFNADAAQFFRMPDRTRGSICATIQPALEWLTDPKAEPATRSGGFDVARFIAQRGTLHLLGAEDALLAPVVTALTGHIAREARRIASTMPKGRLDPPLTLALDEAALICPIPLDMWTADMGGRNITIHIRAQSKAQLAQRWGDNGARAIFNNAATIIVFGGTRDVNELADYSALIGDIPGSRERILSAAQIAQLPFGHAVLIRRGMAPVVGRTLMVWHRGRLRRRLEPVTQVCVALQSRIARLIRRPEPVVVTRKPIAALPAGGPRPELDALLLTTTGNTGERQ